MRSLPVNEGAEDGGFLRVAGMGEIIHEEEGEVGGGLWIVRV